MLRWILAALLALGCLGGVAGGQEIPPQLIAEMQRLGSKPPGELSSAEVRRIGELSIQLSHILLTSKLTTGERQVIAPISVELVDGEGLPAGRIAGNKILLSSDAIAEADCLGLALGHDVYISNGNEFQLRPVSLVQPFNVSQILTLSPASDLVSSCPPAELLTCPMSEVTCRIPQAEAAFLGVLGFLMAHEFGHVLLGHGEKASRPLEEEIAADRKAWDLIHRLGPEKDDDSELGNASRSVLDAGPVLLLKGGAIRENDQQRDARIQALLSLMDKSARAEAETLTSVEEVFGSLWSLKLDWQEEPESLYIEGIPVRPADVKGKSLRVFGSQKIFAVSKGRFAFVRATESVGARGVSLVFQSPRPRSGDEVVELRDGGHWLEIILATATPDLQPRSSTFVVPLSEALQRLGVGRLIRPEWAASASRSDARRVAHWAERSALLATWRP